MPLSCSINGDERQSSTTEDLIFSVPQLISYLSHVATLFPGDLIFTGTPAGVGSARKDYLKPGDVIETVVGGVGEMRNVCVEG